MGYLFQRNKNHPHLYRNAILLFLSVGAFLLWGFHFMIEQLFYINHSPFFERLMQDFVYLRLGNVLLVFGFFALMRNVITSQLIKTIGQKWSEFQTLKYKANTQPFYVLMNHQGENLVAPIGYTLDTDDPDEFYKWLKQGITAFGK